MFPTECRQTGATYTGMFHGKVNWSVNGVKMIPINKIFGEIPIMVKVGNLKIFFKNCKIRLRSNYISSNTVNQIKIYYIWLVLTSLVIMRCIEVGEGEIL